MNRRYGEDSTLLNVAEAADFLRASRAKLYRMIKSGRLVAHKVGATYVLYLRDLNDFVQGRQTDDPAVNNDPRRRL